MFVEVNYSQKQKAGNEICGDVFLSRKIKEENRTLIILSDGLGSGVKANILATMTASMALNFVKVNSPVAHTAKIIMNTLPVDRFRKISYSSFTIIDIEGNNRVKLIEYGNPASVIRKPEGYFKPERKEIKIPDRPSGQELLYSEFDAELNDRIILFSDGISQSGMGKSAMPFGWGHQRIEQSIEEKLDGNETLSAGELAAHLTSRALRNDDFLAKDDISCGVIYFRKPRKVLFCTGPPYKKENDSFLAEQIREFEGNIILSGGTTAQIVSRELNREIEVCMKQSSNGLPPESKMEGVDLVTEGILTLGKVSEYLEKYDHLDQSVEGPAGKILNFFSNNDEIWFLTGTRVNEAHQDPKLPVELEIRRNVVKKIARLLEEKHLKKVKITYI